MFDLKEFERRAQEGDVQDPKEVLDYIRSFENLVLWGAGNLGKAVGEKLLAEQIHITAYWDEKYKEMPECLGIPVTESFCGELAPENTLVISCIVNGTLGRTWTINELEEKGWHHNMMGMVLYEGIFCPLNKDYVNLNECSGRKGCSLVNCYRYINLRCEGKKKEPPLIFQSFTFILSTKCSLNCRYCGQRLHEYKPEDRRDFALEDIKRDIDNFLDAVDFCGMVSIIGGEPFIYPHITEVVKHCLTKENFGIVNITTNGIANLTEELLEEIKDVRVKIHFSLYDTYLNETQKALLQRNIELVKKSGINYSIGQPLWGIPAEIKDYGYSEEIMKNKKKNCENVRLCPSARDGVFHACSFAETIEGLHLYPLGNVVVDLKEKENLRERLMECVNQDYYDICRYCSSEKTQQIVAGEQM
jgi:organic radical activating enzyme